MKYEVKIHSKPGSVGPDWETLKAQNSPRITWESPYLPFRQQLKTSIQEGHLSDFVQHDDRSYTLDDGSLIVHTIFETRQGAENYQQFLDGNPYILSTELIERPEL